MPPRNKELPVPMTFGDLVRNGGVEAYVRAAGQRAQRIEREFWLDVLSGFEPEGEVSKGVHQQYIADLHRRLGIKPDIETGRAQAGERVRRHRDRSWSQAHCDLRSAR
jgi:hypothetical protein